MEGFRLSISMMLLFCSASFGSWNNPYIEKPTDNVLYSAIVGSPKTLDPAKSYSSEENDIIAQIYEPTLQYDPFKLPYQLITLTAIKFPEVHYYAKNGRLLPATAPVSEIAKTVYDIYLQPGIYYQPHPAFAKDPQGNLLYDHLSTSQIKRIRNLSDFKKTGTRELKAADYVYEIKRLASPRLNSPIFGLMNKYIVGLKELDEKLNQDHASFLDLRKYPLAGVKILGPYHFQITINGVNPQFIYWLAMTFFAPIPWEADKFYSQAGFAEKNLSFSWYPVGTGPYFLSENNPNKEMVLTANPNYATEKNRTPPLIKKIVLTLDKESIPRWNKFLQGYYDRSGVSADSFDQAIKIDKNGKAYLSEEMQKKGIYLQTVVEPGVYYIGFNMLDPVVGGYSKRATLLRRAIAIAINHEEFISIFMNGRGVPAQGPIPPGIFGHEPGKNGNNPYVYNWVNGKPKRKSIAEAKKLLAEAGYPGGIDPATKQPLLLNYDVASTGSPDDRADFDWLREQFARLGIRLNIRATLYNQFQDQVQKGKEQIFSWGWMADYPDPENFLFLLYGPNGRVKYGGANETNYSNPKVDALYEEIRLMPNGPERQKKINELLEIVRADSPWVWGFHPITFVLSHQWNKELAPNPMARNRLKYGKINPEVRAKLRQQWNHPTFWPFVLIIIILFFSSVALLITYYSRERRSTIIRINEDKK